MLYTEKEKHEIERVKEVFAEHLRQSPDFELLWSDKVGYVWLTIGVNPVYVDTGIRIESAADLCCKCLDDVAMDVLYMTGNDMHWRKPIRWNWPKSSGAGGHISTSYQTMRISAKTC